MLSSQKHQREISAGIIIYRRTNEGIKFLLLYHGGGYWNFPKGKLEFEPRMGVGILTQGKEKSWEAAVRETREETGLKLSDLKFQKGFRAYEKFVFWRKIRNRKIKVFKVVIFYLAETRKSQINISEEHEGYGLVV